MTTTPPTSLTPDAPTIEALRRRACTSIARCVALAFGPGQPRERFDSSMELLEEISKRACKFLNSLYLHSARDLKINSVPALEQKLMELGRKPLSFGDYKSAMEFFLNKLYPSILHVNLQENWLALAAPLKEPIEIGKPYGELELIKSAREKYAIPVERLNEYVRDHSKSPAKKQSLAQVLGLATLYRNSKAHHHDWFTDDERWYPLLLERWQRILEQVLLHPPVYRLLTSVEQVNTQGMAHMIASEKYLSDAIRVDLDELRRPLGESKLASRTHLVAGSYWATRSEQEQAPLQLLFPVREFPENVESKEQREQRYCASVAKVYMNAGVLRAIDIDTILFPLRNELGIEEKAAETLEKDTVAAIRAAETESIGGEDNGALNKIQAMLAHGEAGLNSIEQQISKLDQLRSAWVYSLIEDQWPISHASLKHHSEMPPEDLDRVLSLLLDSADPSLAIRKVEPTPGKVHYRIPNTQTTQELTNTLTNLQAQPEWIDRVRPLLEVCRQFFLEEGHAELPATINKLLQYKTPGSGSPTATQQESAIPKLLFATQGHLLTASSVPDLLREIVSHFGKDNALQAKVPFATGRRRNLVAREPRHAAGHEFISPLVFGENNLIFESNQSRYSVLKSLRQWFTAAGIPVERAEIDGHSLEDLSVDPTRGNDPEETASDDLILQLQFDGCTEQVTGATAGQFLSNVVQLLVAKGRLSDEQLPILIGRIRYLVAPTPFHANGRKFDAPVEAEGMFIESALTRRDARAHATTLCHQLKINVLNADLEAEVDS